MLIKVLLSVLLNFKREYDKIYMKGEVAAFQTLFFSVFRSIITYDYDLAC